MKLKIKELRKLNGDTLKQLASKINYDYSNLSKIERGIYSPSLSLLEKIANTYSVEVHTLFEAQENYTQEEESLIKDLDISSSEISKKYNIEIDGERITEEELKFIIGTIRILRDTIQNGK
ncbi:helix-turn-helix transcriptional regulator [Fictibacillus sp. 23RED33]|nr:helix-turn-helix transcriptional regulator [Fictibacillus sp. 23RED33]MBH0175713.1 helix-turn-helix transcriptional regulator [Fictibacillus sp. 23RED33]